MDRFRLYSQNDISTLVSKRPGEEKLGEHVSCAASIDDIKQLSAKFVLIGVPEDIGIRANFGIAGAKTAWYAALKFLLNIQSNAFLTGKEILVLGHFEIDEPEDQSIDALRDKTSLIDALVSPLIQKIVAMGKIPIVIGGGHNNAAPIITGTAKALNQPINVVNIDAHSDLRRTDEGRHSGNGFSYAMENGHLNAYFAFGLHQNYIQAKLLSEMVDHPKIKFMFFDEMLSSNTPATDTWRDFIAELPEPCGMEIDLDGICSVLSSAMTPSGFTLNEVRKFIICSQKNFRYLHICEGAVALSDGRTDASTGKTIAYLISDFIKALPPHTAPKLGS